MSESEYDPIIIVALIAALSSLLVAVVGYFSTRRNQKTLSSIQQSNQRELEALKVELAERQAEKDARRDYEYEARKRLYQECEPLLFQLAEVSGDALYRIFSLARSARRGDITPNDGGWLSGAGYYMATTVYKLLSPTAYLKLIQRRLTLVDLSLDPKVRAHYMLAKALYDSFIDDFGFASIDPVIEYDPNIKDWKKRRKEDPQKYWRQGLTWGRLDLASDGLLVREPPDTLRLMNYGEFEEVFSDIDSQLYSVFASLIDVFNDFHPSTRPILWRILITQAHIYKAIERASQHKLIDPKQSRDLLQPISSEEGRQALYWYKSDDQETVIEEPNAPFDAAWKYLEQNVKPLLIWDDTTRL